MLPPLHLHSLIQFVTPAGLRDWSILQPVILSIITMILRL